MDDDCVVKLLLGILRRFGSSSSSRSSCRTDCPGDCSRSDVVLDVDVLVVERRHKDLGSKVVPSFAVSVALRYDR